MSPPASGSTQVDAYISGLDGDTKAIVSLLRQLALAARSDVTEHIKWKAPSFCVGGEDRITFGLDPKGGVRVVLHRGAKAKDTADFRFADSSGLVRWAAPDRGVLGLRAERDVTDNRNALADLFARWIQATAEAV